MTFAAGKQYNQKNSDKFSQHFMSNAKWKKLFYVLSQNNDIVKKCIIKAVAQDVLQEIKIPLIQDFDKCFSDIGIKDIMIGGPLRYKDIEWIEFPVHEQDIIKIKSIIDQIGRFAMELNEKKLFIFGYKK